MARPHSTPVGGAADTRLTGAGVDEAIAPTKLFSSPTRMPHDLICKLWVLIARWYAGLLATVVLLPSVRFAFGN